MKELRFNLPDELAEKFELAVQLAGDNRDAVAEEFVRQYLTRALQSAADAFRSPSDPAPQPASAPASAPFGSVRADSASRARQIPPPPPTPPREARPDHERPPRPDYWQEWGKAIGRIPRWARNPQQNNHKILRAWFELQRELGEVTIDALRRRCSDPLGHPNTYVPHFDNNFSQMKFDNGNSHGKVFEEHDGYISIWDRISDTLQEYRDYFL